MFDKIEFVASVACTLLLFPCLIYMLRYGNPILALLLLLLLFGSITNVISEARRFSISSKAKKQKTP